MHTPMRRKSFERKDPEFISYVLNKADEIYIAFSTEDAPYIVPINFVYLDEKIYFHCALQGRKLECIKKNPKVGFSTAVDINIIADDATTLFNSVIGTGSALLVEDDAEKAHALDAIAKRYKAGCELPTPPKSVMKTAIVRIDIESVCGKNKTTSVNMDK